MKEYYIYILECADKTYYTGFTSNLEKRIQEHESGKYKDSYTYKRRPVKLVFYASFSDVNMAIEKEKQIKKWSKAKKKALIEGKYEDLINLAKKDLKNSISIHSISCVNGTLDVHLDTIFLAHSKNHSM